MAIDHHMFGFIGLSLALAGCGVNNAATHIDLNQTSELITEQNSAQAHTPLSVPGDQAGVPETLESDNDSTNALSCNANTAETPSVFIALINKARAQARQCGNTSHEAAGPLSWNAKLAEASMRHSNDMASNNFFSHTGSGNTSAADRVNAVQYEWQFVGENLAAGQPSLQLAIEGWLGSPGHCRNIMNPSFKEAGLACAENQSTEFNTYWTNVFGAQFE